MRKITMLALCVLVSAAVVAGCARKRTYSTPGGKVTVTERGSGDTAEVTIEGEEGRVEIRGDEQSAKVTTKEGTAEINKSMTEEEVGLPFYPGAKPGGSSRFQGKDGTSVQTALTTSDSVDDVKAFYTKRLPKATTAMDATSDGARIVNIILEEGRVHKMVSISREKDGKETQIMLRTVQKSE